MKKINTMLYFVGKNIVRFRKKAGITQKELAHKIRRRQSVISKLESGVKLPNDDDFFKILLVLGCTIDDVLDFSVFSN